MAWNITAKGDILLQEASPKIPHYQVVFEDEGETGYFYACDKRNGDDPIVDALHIYDVAEAEKGKKLYLYQIVWSEDGFKAALFMDNFCHAVFNFDSGRGILSNKFSFRES